jgi:hypothetical protein
MKYKDKKAVSHRIGSKLIHQQERIITKRYWLALMLVYMLVVPIHTALGDEQTIDEIMSQRLDEVHRALLEFGQTKSPEKLSEVEKLNDRASDDLFTWWHSVTSPCCMPGDIKNPELAWRESLEKNGPILNSYLKTICGNHIQIARSYEEIGDTKKARLIYSYVMNSFNSPVFDTCAKEAESRIRKLR